MDKGQIYKTVINSLRNYGTGIIFPFRGSNYGAMAESLVKDGYLRIVEVILDPNQGIKQEFLYLPEGYCVHEDENFQAVNFLKRYLDIEQHNEAPFNFFLGDNKKIFEKWLSDTEEEYNQWVLENSSKLELYDNLPKGEDLEEIIEEINTFEEKFMDYLKSRDWYVNNKTAKECREIVENYIEILSQIVGKYEELSKINEDYKSGYKEKKLELKINKKILSKITTDNSYIQALIY
jgi:hypothetical protein